MENTLENKAKFFAQYYGQNLIHSSFTNEINEVNGFLGNLNKNYWLELKPLSQITNEDACELYRTYDNGFTNEYLKYKGVHEDEFLWFTSTYENGETYNYYIDLINLRKLTLNAVDYLRSKGYALPYNGLSVEKLVEYGWVKLKEYN